MKCGVCGEEIKGNPYTYSYKGKTYYFCSPMCMVEFKKRPEKYAK
ncbi:MAG: YHS domain-containing protein [Saccharolobus sp.]|jgi:YHS domain-containing protein